MHNIPQLLQRWEHCDEALLRSFLETFDAKWTGSSSGDLLAAYQDAIERGRG